MPSLKNINFMSQEQFNAMGDTDDNQLYLVKESTTYSDPVVQSIALMQNEPTVFTAPTNGIVTLQNMNVDNSTYIYNSTNGTGAGDNIKSIDVQEGDVIVIQSNDTQSATFTSKE